jgi:ribosomal protein L13E
VVQHYAGNVEYYPTDFLEKNTETLNNDLVECMMTSTDTTLQYLFSPANDEDGEGANSSSTSSSSSAPGTPAKKAQRSISWKFQSQLTSLMTMLRQTQSHFIRCVKSNDECKPLLFDAKNVTRQLLYSGVFEVVKIQQSGLPCRATHREFLERFKSLAPFNIRYKFRSPQELIDIFKAPPLQLGLTDMQNGSTMVFFKGLDQRLLESYLATWHRVNAVKIQSFRRCRYLHRVFTRMIVWIRLLQVHAANYKADEARACLAEIELCLQFYDKSCPHSKLHRMYRVRSDLVELTQQRENLIQEAQRLADTKNEASLQIIGSIVPRAESLGISSLPIVRRCGDMDTSYKTALMFIKQAASESLLSALSMNEIVAGINSLTEFEMILAAAPSTLARAIKWKAEVEEELNGIFETLLHKYELAAVEFDEETGRLRRTIHGSAETEEQLRSFTRSLVPQRFKCKDTLHAYNDTIIFLRLLDEALLPNSGEAALSIIASYQQRPHFEVSIAQMLSFEKWATFICSVKRLDLSLRVDGIVASMDSQSSHVVVTTQNLEQYAQPLRSLRNPPSDIVQLLAVTADIIQLRQLYLTKDWKALEDFTYQVESHVETGLFEGFSHSCTELENSIWITSYYNTLSDLTFVITDPVISQLPLYASDWSQLLVNSESSQLVLASTSSFSSMEKTPVLEELLPVARLMVDLRQELYAVKIPLVQTIINLLVNDVAVKDAVERHGLSISITAEISACKKLVAIVTCEEELNDALRKNQVQMYTCAPPDPTNAKVGGLGISKTASEMNICGAFGDLQVVTDKIRTLCDEEMLPDSLHRLYQIGKRILAGRIAVAQNEQDDHSYDYDDVITTVLKSTSSANGHISIRSDSGYVEETFRQEIDSIVLECHRRCIIQQLKEILLSKCVLGVKYVDLRVDAIVLRDAENMLQAVKDRLKAVYPDPSPGVVGSQSRCPANLSHLAQFVEGIMAMRRMFQRSQWTDLYTALSNLQSVLNDDGLAIPGIVEEIESIRAQYICTMEMSEMKESLVEISSIIDETKNALEKAAVIDRVSDALFVIHKIPGPHTSKLFELGSLVRIILLKILENQASSIPESKVLEASNLYQELGLTSEPITLIYKYIRLRHCLQYICDTIVSSSNPTSELLFETLDLVKAELTIPTVLVPWLHCAESYAQLLQALECRDWLIIVNRSRYLEELLVPLSLLPSYDPDHETRLLQLAKARCQESYKVALAIKAVETELQITATVENVPVNEIMKRTIREVDEGAQNGQSVSAWRCEGKTNQEIVDSGKFPLNQLWAMDVPAELLRVKGYSVLKMRAAGYSCLELLEGGYSVDALGKAGYEGGLLRKAGASLQQLRTAGFSDAKILMAGYPVSELKEAGFDAGRLAKVGIGAKDLVTAGFTGKELRLAGFSAEQLRRAGMDRVGYLRASGFMLAELVNASFTVAELKGAGFDFDCLREVGVPDMLLLEAGFSEELTREVLLDLFEVTGGKHWKIKMNWGTNRPLREWYGVTVELGIHEMGHHMENVVGLDLHDNNLCGELSPRLGLLTHLKTLNLSMNNLHGLVPACLTQMKELMFIDLTSNPLLRELEKGGKKRTPRSPVSKPPPLFSHQNGSSAGMTGSGGSLNPKGSATPRGVTGNAVNLLGFMKAQPPPSTNRDEKLQDQLFHPQRDDEAFGRTEQSLSVELFNSTQGHQWKLKRNWCTPAPLSQWFGLSVNRLDRIVKIQLPMNNLTGEIPTSIDSLIHLRELDLRYNQLFGIIPVTIGNLKQLTHLYLHCNRLTGSIPESVTDLARLELLDLRSNQLTGTLPADIVQLTNLQYLAITSNFIKVPSKQAVKNKIPWCRVVIT